MELLSKTLSRGSEECMRPIDACEQYHIFLGTSPVCRKGSSERERRRVADFRGVPLKAKAMAEAGRVEEVPAPPTSNWPNQVFFFGTPHLYAHFLLTHFFAHLKLVKPGAFYGTYYFRF